MSPSRAPLAVSLWLGGVVGAAAFAYTAIPVLAPEVARDANLPITFVGWYTAAVWLSQIFLSTSSGSLIPRFGAWRLTQVCLLCCAVGLCCAATGTAWGVAAGALLLGLGHGLEGPASSQLLSQFVPPRQQPLLFSLKQSGVQVGSFVASASLPLIALALGWQQACLIVALLLLVGMASMQRAMSDWPAPPMEAGRRIGSVESLQRLAASPDLRRMSLCAGAFAATQICLNGWFVTYAVTERGVSLVQAGQWLAVAQAGGFVGRILWGWVASRSGRPAAVLRGLGLVTAACAALLGLFGAQLPELWMWPLLAIFGLTAAGWNGVFLAEVSLRVPPSEVGSATGAVMVVMTAGLVGGPLAFGAVGSYAGFGPAYLMAAVVALFGVAVLPRSEARSLHRGPEAN
jgi:MFS family permease